MSASQLASGGVAHVGGRVTLQVAGRKLVRWTSMRTARDLKEIAGSFQLEYLDSARNRAAGGLLTGADPGLPAIAAGMPVTLLIDEEPVLVGYIDDLDLEWDGLTLRRAQIVGRDKTGDLVDCAAAPEGPAEFRNLTLLQIAQKICAPFGIRVRADVDIGAAFDRLAINPHETALATLEKAARQRTVLLVSDGTGGLLLTRGGTSRAPSPLRVGELVQHVRYHDSWRGRFSDTYVKGQTDGHRKRGAAAATLSHTVVPFAPGPPPDLPKTSEASTVLMTGHARDPEITRYRPHVRTTRTQSGMSTTQEQAEWAVRVARGMGQNLIFQVLDWRAGPDKALWRPNQLSAVYEPYSGTDKDMLIAGVSYLLGPDGLKTELRLVGPTAFDRINEAERRRHHSRGEQRKLDSTVRPFQAN